MRVASKGTAWVPVQVGLRLKSMVPIKYPPIIVVHDGCSIVHQQTSHGLASTGQYFQSFQSFQKGTPLARTGQTLLGSQIPAFQTSQRLLVKFVFFIF
jgi:hypothetical protein